MHRPRSSRLPATGPAHSELRRASVDVELVALGALHRNPVVIEALVAEAGDDRGPEAGQAPRLGVYPLLAGRERHRMPAAHVHVKVQAVLDGLEFRHHLEPDPWPVAATAIYPDICVT